MKNKLLAMLTAVVVAATSFSVPVQEFIGANVVAEAATTVAIPTSNRKSATYSCSGNLKITLSCATSGATIYYSANGGKTYRRYSKPFYITKNTTIKVRAYKDGVYSKTRTYTYKMTPKYNINLDSGTYNGKQTIKLSSPVSGVKFYYTLDGSTPTTKSALYTAKGITIDESCKLRIRVYKSGWSARVVTKNYTIENAQQGSLLTNTSILEDYKSKYAYSTLSDTQKKVYERLYNGIKDHEASIDISDLKANSVDVNKAFWAMDYENPQFFWLGSGYGISYISDTVLYVKPKYSRSEAQAKAIQPKLDAAVKEIVDGALAKKTLFERVLYIHDAIVNATSYTTSGGEYKRDADGPLVNGSALCEGYSKAFVYLCQSIGIEAACISGDAGGDHMWNIVKLDGDWYQMDVTFDDPVSTVPLCQYNYFCITTAQMNKDHTIDNIFTVPACNEDDYNYFVAQNITVYSNATTAYKALIKAAAANYAKGVKRTEITCSSSCCTSLHKLMGTKPLFDDLNAAGCEPNSLKYGYTGSTFYVVLS